ncbi:MAG: heterodisulfide reductase-related iron-sulfur binding cluster [Acidimicrobiales bacterium]
MFGPDLVRAFADFKDLWDPTGVMNPGKIVRAARPDQHLRLGTDHQPAAVATTFAFSADDGSMARATQRCVGVGRCRRTDGGTMCPSYMVTLEEVHSTRGRAHLLWELLNGEEIDDGWRSSEVAESLDLCLSCKGCKHDCPVDVDLATYKAEFLSHHYARRLRPRPAYAMGLIAWWARIASRAPRLVNRLASVPVLHRALTSAAGLTDERPVPTFSRRTLRRRLAGRPVAGRASGAVPKRTGSRGRVLLWLDTFTDHFDAEIGVAAVEALEALGFEVVLPRSTRCCGRPLYDYGMLTLARRWLEGIVDDLRDEIRSGTPVVVLEPSCLAVFRDELTELLPHDHDARRLAAQTYGLAELVGRHVDLDDLAAGSGPDVLYHPHCHQQAVVGTDADHALLAALGCEVTDSEAGCCGLAGSFGFEAEKYDVSVAIGERKLAPMVRDLGTDAVVVADGFSCRTQVADLTGRRPRHVAELLRDRVAPSRREEHDA